MFDALKKFSTRRIHASRGQKAQRVCHGRCTPRHHGGRHDYDGAAFGETGETVSSTFARYLDYFADKGIFGEVSAGR